VNASAPGAYLIVNADDYGYFRCVSEGILEVATHGIVKATGVFANAPHFREHAARLLDCENLDVGSHLNLTYGSPLTTDLRKRLSRWSGNFPGKISLSMAVLSGAIRPEHVGAEWRAQIDRCLECGLRVQFLNSHEHVHMLPALFSVAEDLAREYRIRYVRFATSRLVWNSPTVLFRTAVLKWLGAAVRRRLPAPALSFLGLEASGRLDLPYLRRVIPQLRAGRVYELMCHPGRFDAREVSDPRLVHYHDWEGERRTLLDPVVRDIFDRHRVQLVGYRDLEIRNGGIGVLPAAVGVQTALG
jgi:predicted glycoside hydrolase/deacetylase ChbG (UPF0249 family)